MNQPTHSPAPTLRSALEQGLAFVIRYLNQLPEDIPLVVAYAPIGPAIDDCAVLEAHLPVETVRSLDPDNNPPAWAASLSYQAFGETHYRLTLRIPLPVYFQRAMHQALRRFTNSHLQGDIPTKLDGFDVLEGRVFLHSVSEQARSDSLPGIAASFSMLYYAPDNWHAQRLLANVRYTPVPLDEPLWKVRERVRGIHTYAPLPDALLQVLPPEVMDAEFPHIAIKEGNAGMIAYTASERAGILDRQQVMKPGRYIRQHCPQLTDEQVKQLAAEVTGALDADIHVSHDPDEFERVYRRGPSSCMAYGPDGKCWNVLYVDGDFYHPARVYAHPENHIRIVWLEQGGRIGARTLINTKRMQYPTIYASDAVARARYRLELWLDANGYTQNDHALRGEKLIRQAVDRDPDSIICPYIDCGNQGVEVYHDHLIVGGPYEADHETGCLEDFNPDGSGMVHCDDCDRRVDAGDTYTTVHNEEVCQFCVDDNYTHVYDLDEGATRYAPDGSSYIYRLHSSVSRSSFHFEGLVYTESRSTLQAAGLVELCSHYYDDSDLVAEQDDCIEDEDGDWLLTEDVEQFGLFIDEGDDVARPIADWAVLIDEDGDWDLTRREDIDPDEAVETTAYPTNCPYAMLPCYAALAEVAETEDVA
ncbi:hypothetical protein [Pseudomonas sp. RL]|uniref:hypothetical protein n=1 Tax=Pseudomonas sp. RL TaxID=1452718 RepID=UPI0004832C8C|nr:hypothetical protein [Pseudomonas sp. RL]